MSTIGPVGPRRAPRPGRLGGVAAGPDDPRDPVLITWARGLGALQEAERLGTPRVGSEHLLLATLLDPVARRLAHDAGLDFTALQRHLGPPVRAGIGGHPDLLPAADQMHLSDGAVQHLDALRAGAADDPRFADWVRPDRSTDPRARSVLRRRLLGLLVESTEPGAARTALDELGIETRAAWLVARLAEPDQGSSVSPGR